MPAKVRRAFEYGTHLAHTFTEKTRHQKYFQAVYAPSSGHEHGLHLLTNHRLLAHTRNFHYALTYLHFLMWIHVNLCVSEIAVKLM